MLLPDKTNKRDKEIKYSDEELNLEQMLTAALTSRSQIPLDLQINDSDLKEFPNFYTFCFDKMGANQVPFARQLAIATRLLAEWCPLCSGDGFEDIHKIPKDYPAIDFPEKVTFLEYGVCPECGSRKSDLYKRGLLNVYEELDGCAGQRSGKSALLAQISPYLIHKWLKMQKPVEALGLLSNSILVGTFVGLTFDKAVELLWMPIHNMVMECKWFIEYMSLLDHYEEKYGRNLYKIKDTYIQFRHRNLLFMPSGPNKRTLRGPTRIISCIDELGWFLHGEGSEKMERASANEVYIALDRSLKTVRKQSMGLLRKGFDNVPMALSCNISSPSSHMDKIMSLVRNHSESKKVLTYHLATWKMNPMFDKKDFTSEYREDPIKAERDFGANPPMSSNPWINDISKIESCITTKPKTQVNYMYKHMLSKSKQMYRYAVITSIKKDKLVSPSIMALDAGYNKNSFAIAIVTPLDFDKTEINALVEITPRYGKNVLNYTRIVQDIMYRLIEEFNVQLLVVDRWQSVKILSDVDDAFGIYAESVTLTRDDFDLIYDYIMSENKIIFPKPEMEYRDIQNINLDIYPHCFKYKPAAHLFFQFMVATVNPKGVVEKGDGYTDDLLRATCLGLTLSLDDNWRNNVQRAGSKSMMNKNYFIGTKVGSANPNSMHGVKSTHIKGNFSASRPSSIGSRG